MPGLLKKLQKSRPQPGGHAESVDSATITIPAPEEITRDLPTREIDRRVVEAEVLLEDLVRESGKQTIPKARPAVVEEEVSSKEGANAKDRRVVRRNSSLGGKKQTTGTSIDDSLPSWTRPERRLSPQSEALLISASKIVDAALNETSLGETAGLLKHAIEEGKGFLPVDLRVTWKDEEVVERELKSLIFEKGPLALLFDDANVQDIHIDNYRSVKVYRKGLVIETPFHFRTPEEYSIFLKGLLKQGGRVLGRNNPIVDCVVNDKWHSRVNAIDAAVAHAEEPRACIRIPRQKKFSFYDALQAKVLPPTLGAWLAELISQREANILIAGGAGSGKTLITAALASEIGSDERIVTIEEMPEIYSASTPFEKLVACPGDESGVGEVSLAMLVQAAIRRNPHRVILGDIVGEESKYYLRALESGFSGSLASVYADSPEDGLWRLLDLLSAYESAPQFSLMRRIARSIHLVIGMQRVDDKPCLTEIMELQPLQGPDFSLTPLVQLENVVEGKRKWRIMSKRSYWIDRLAERGMTLKVGPGLLEYRGK